MAYINVEVETTAELDMNDVVEAIHNDMGAHEIADFVKDVIDLLEGEDDYLEET